MPKQRELIAEFIRERNVFNNEDETRVVICDVLAGVTETELGDDPIVYTIKGEAAEGRLRPGLVYRFYGHWFTHWKHGEQFVFAAFTVEQPATEDAVVAYLQQCKGIGPGIARRLWDNYGSNAIAALRTNPAKCADEIKGLKADVADAAAEFLQQFEGIERVKTDLMGLLAGRGFPKKTVDHAIRAWGSDAAVIIRRCPYYLMRFRGCGFLKTDKMYLDLGLPPGKLKRQALCAWHAIARDSEGHTWHPLSFAQGAISRSVSGGQLRAEKATELAVRAGYLAVKEQDGCMWVAEAAKANQEERCARAIDEALDEEASWPPIDVLAEQGLSEHQLEELTKALGGVVGILAGAPGTGKTHSAAAVIREIIRSAGDGMVAAAAPTGKAAVRLTELLDANGISLKAITIHRLLQVESSGGEGGWSFRYRSGNPLPFRYVLIDESSMIDTGLMASLLEARAPGTHYLFLGDPYQLAPVGHGCPLKDMINAGVPCGELKEIRRNAGRIVRACAAIRDEKRFVPSPAVDLENGENLMHVETSGHAETIDRLRQFVESIKAGGKYDPVWDVQILCAVNKKSPLGRRPLNDLLQGILNAGGEQAPPNKFRRGDKVIDLKNGWLQSQDKEHPEANEQGKVFVANGEIGEALVVEPARTICRLQSPDRVVTVLHSKAGGKDSAAESDEDDKQGPGRKDEDNDDDTGTGSTWDLAFAISCHKSQGSEFPVAVILLDEHPSAGRVCTRNWLFTGISRAKKLCVTIGPARVAHAMCQKDGLRRRTFLVEWIQELRLPPPAPPPEPVAVSDEVFAGIFESLLVGASV